MNPSTLFSLGLPALVAWCLLDDYQRALIKRGLATPPEIHPDPPQVPLERVVVQPMAYPTPAPQPQPQPTAPKTMEQRKARLIEVLDSNGLRPFWELRNATPVRFCGWQRSGKSTKAQTLALLRQLDNPQHPVSVCTPHRPTPGDRPWASSFSVAGEGNNWPDIKAVIDGMMQRLAKGDTAPYTTILDEFSGYPGNGGMTDGYIQEVMLSAIREMAKHSEMLVLIAHGSTTILNGNVKGLSAAMWGNFVTVNCSRLLVDGKATPGPEVTISGGGFPDTRLNWPSWFTPDWLLSQFPELSHIAPAKAPDRNAPPQLQPDFEIDLPGLIEQDQALTIDDGGGLPPHLAAVLDYLRRKGSASPRQIQQAKLGALTNTDHNTSQNIQLMLDSLVFSGHAQPLEDGSYAPLGVGQRPN